MVTTCLLEELIRLGDEYKHVYDCARQFYHHKCGHCKLSTGKSNEDIAEDAANAVEDSEKDELLTGTKRTQEYIEDESSSSSSDNESVDDIKEEDSISIDSEDKMNNVVDETNKDTQRRKWENKPMNGGTCLLRVIGWGNERRLCAATNDRKLQSKIRGIPGCPLIFVFDQNLELNPPTAASHAIVKKEESRKQTVKNWEKPTLKVAAEVEEDRRQRQSANSKKHAKRARKDKGANPLSCKKSSKQQYNKPSVQLSEPKKTIQTTESGDTRIRVRIRKSHLKAKKDDESQE